MYVAGDNNMFELVMVFAAFQLIIESLPISSSGHVKLLQFFLERSGHYITEGLSEALDHALHGPTLLILAIYFRAQWLPLLSAILKSLTSYLRARCVITDLPFSQRTLLALVARIVGMVIIADCITALGYFLFRDALHLEFSDPLSPPFHTHNAAIEKNAFRIAVRAVQYSRAPVGSTSRITATHLPPKPLHQNTQIHKRN